MESFRILHVEDNPGRHIGTELSLIEAGIDTANLLQVVDKQTALSEIRAVADGEREKFDFVIVDDNLSNHHRDGRDGRDIVAAVGGLEDAKRPITIGLGEDLLRRYGIEVDIDLGKHNVRDLGHAMLTAAQESAA